MPSSDIQPYGSGEFPEGVYFPLTEDAIKRAFIPHLKAFYKFRYVIAPDTVNTSLDNVSEKGLVADGMLTFRKEDGEAFVCTYEATSLDKSGEVKYSLNAIYFIWDCLAFAAISCAVGYGWLFVTRLPWLSKLLLPGNLGLLLGIATISFFSWYYLLRGWRKYRYIYAIEQFKRYYADEQWIAIGENVFPAPTDPYLIELKSQCIYQGFGLAIVYSNGAVRNLVTPSRLGMFGKDRKMVHWLTRNDWYKAVSNNLAFAAKNRPSVPDELRIIWNKIWRPFRYQFLKPIGNFIWHFLKDPLNDSNTAFERYMHGRSIQQWIFGFALLAIALLGYRVSQYSTENFIDPATMLKQKRGPNPEDEPYIIDGDPIPYHPGGISKQYPAHNKSKTPPKQKSEDDGEIQVINLSGDDQ